MVITVLVIIVIIQSAGLLYLWQLTPTTAEDRTTLVLGAPVEIGRNLHPQTARGGDNDLIRQIYEGLFGYEYGEIFELEPVLAADMGEVSEDGLTWTFSLRQGVKFQDGTDFNATAVKDHFDSMFEIQQGITYMFHQALLNRTEIVDTYTVRFVLNYPNVAFRYMLAAVPGKIPSPTASEAARDAGLEIYEGEYIGTGPYQLTSYVTDQEAILDAHLDWWNAVPGETHRIQTLEYIVIPDASTLKLALERGTVDLSLGVLNEDDYPSLLENPDLQSYDISTASSARWLQFNFNTTVHDTFPNNKLLRQAFAYAINYDVIIDTVYEGEADRLYSYLPAEYAGYAEVSPYDYEPATALQLIDDAGYETPIEMTIYTSGSYTSREADMLQVIKEYALAAGFDVTIETQEIGVFRDQYRNTDNQEMTLWRWRADYPAADNWNVPFMSSYGYGTGRCKVTEGDMGPLYPAIDDLIAQAAGTTNETEFIELVTELQELWAEWVPNIFLYRPKLFQFGDASLQGIWFGGLQWDVNYHRAYFA